MSWNTVISVNLSILEVCINVTSGVHGTIRATDSCSDGTSYFSVNSVFPGRVEIHVKWSISDLFLSPSYSYYQYVLVDLG